MVTIKDIAKEAGVSYSTVSVALGNRTSRLPLAEKTRQKVMEAANRLGYRRNALATQMQTGKTGFMSFIACDAAHEYVFNIFAGAIKSANNAGYSLKLHEVPVGEPDYENRRQEIILFYDHILETRPEGIIIASWVPHQEYLLQEAKQLKIPVGCSDCKNGGQFDVKAVFDAFQGEHGAVKRLFEQGHRRFGFISDGLERPYVQPRFNGFMDALSELGLEVCQEWMMHSDHRNNDDIIRFVKQLCGQKERPTAICCSSDYVALQVLTTAAGNGWRVPDELSLVGFGDIDFTIHANPKISTVVQDYQTMGYELMQRIAGRIGNPEVPPETIEFPTTYLARESVIDCKQ